jgi:hypothetical protein
MRAFLYVCCMYERVGYCSMYERICYMIGKEIFVSGRTAWLSLNLYWYCREGVRHVIESVCISSKFYSQTHTPNGVRWCVYLHIVRLRLRLRRLNWIGILTATEVQLSCTIFRPPLIKLAPYSRSVAASDTQLSQLYVETHPVHANSQVTELHADIVETQSMQIPRSLSCMLTLLRPSPCEF